MKWEYKIVQPSSDQFRSGFNSDYRALEEDLNKLGSEGWELVGIMPNPRYDPYTRGGDDTYGALILKRGITQ